MSSTFSTRTSGRVHNLRLGIGIQGVAPYFTEGTIELSDAEANGYPAPVSLWKLNESVGPYVNAITAEEGDVFGASGASGIESRCYEDGGGGGYAAFPDAAIYDATTLSFQFWVRSADVTGVHVVMTHRYSDGLYQYAGWDVATVGATLYVQVDDGTTNYSGGSITINTWHHVYASHTVGGPLRIWIDAVEQTGDRSAGYATAGRDDYVGQLWIGRQQPPGTPYLYNGRVDELAFWDAALTQAQISAAYAKGLAGESLA